MNTLVDETNITQVRLTAERKLRGNGGPESTNAESQTDELAEHSQRLEQLVGQVENLPDPHARELLQECMAAVLRLHGLGLDRIFQIIQDAGAAGTQVREDLLRDKVVRGLLLIHGLHPVSLETRLHEALEKVRPYMESHGGNVEIVSAENGVAKLRLQGTCHGCPSSAVTLELAIRQALEEACPDLLGLEVEGVVPQEDVKFKLPANAPSWTIVQNLGVLDEGAMKAVQVNGSRLLFCKARGQLYAYRDACPACEESLEAGALVDGVLRCRLGHRFDVRLAGACPDNPELHLNPVPLLAVNGSVKVSVR